MPEEVLRATAAFQSARAQTPQKAVTAAEPEPSSVVYQSNTVAADVTPADSAVADSAAVDAAADAAMGAAIGLEVHTERGKHVDKKHATRIEPDMSSPEPELQKKVHKPGSVVYNSQRFPHCALLDSTH